MQLKVRWKGFEYESVEECRIGDSASGIHVSSDVWGAHRGLTFHIAYTLQLTSSWETVGLRLTALLNQEKKELTLHHDGKGNWSSNSCEGALLQGCTDIDMPLTPFTNSLPVNRLRMKPGDSHEIRVAYCDVLNSSIVPVRQKYTRLSGTSYHYQNVPNDFEAVIDVNDAGIVLQYPGLFMCERIASFP